MNSSKSRKALDILDRLEDIYPDARIQLDYETPYQLLIATILAAQCTDERVNQVTPRLWEEFPAPSDVADAPAEKLQEIIRPTGFYRRKSESIQKVSRALVERYNGEVPDDLDALTQLPGVGRKTANVVLSNAMGKEAIAVDTHVKRVSRRIGLTNKKDPDKIERDLCNVIPEERWTRATQLIGTHGRRICESRKPRCEECPVSDMCDYFRGYNTQ
jgi:endonuclease-3